MKSENGKIVALVRGDDYARSVVEGLRREMTLWKIADESEPVDYRWVSPQMKNKLVVSQSILWATALLVVALVDDTQYLLFLLALLATAAVVNLNKNN